MSALTTLLNTYRNAAVSEREEGTYFEELIVTPRSTALRTPTP